MEIGAYWQQIRTRICHRCIDGDSRGACHLPGGEASCALKQFLPEIVTTVLHTSSSDMEVHIDSLRKNVCTHCDWQKPDASCKKRDE